MQVNYFKVPDDTLTCKDLDYLSDMFQWNYGCLKSSNEAISQVNDRDIIEILNRAINLFDDNINTILNVLSDNGGEYNG